MTAKNSPRPGLAPAPGPRKMRKVHIEKDGQRHHQPLWPPCSIGAAIGPSLRSAGRSHRHRRRRDLRLLVGAGGEPGLSQAPRRRQQGAAPQGGAGQAAFLSACG